MQNQISINPIIVLQTTLGLVTAISVTDALRDGISALNVDPLTTAYYRGISVVCIILLSLCIVRYFSTCTCYEALKEKPANNKIANFNNMAINSRY